MRRIHFHHARRDSQCHVIQNNALQDEHPMWWLKDEALARDRTFNPWRQVSRPGQDSPNRLLHDACRFQPSHHQKNHWDCYHSNGFQASHPAQHSKSPHPEISLPNSQQRHPTTLRFRPGKAAEIHRHSPEKNLISDSISQRLARPVSLRHLIRSEV